LSTERNLDQIHADGLAVVERLTERLSSCKPMLGPLLGQK
jgi:hypothetical protein